MRIGIDCRLWNETGLGRYIRNIISELARMDEKNEYILFVLEKDFADINLPANFTKVVTNVRWYTFKEQFVMPIYFYRNKLDLLFAPNLNVPVLYLKKIIVTIHDLTVLKMNTGRVSTLPYPAYLFKKLAVTFNLWITVKRAHTIFTVSRFVQEEITKKYSLSNNSVLITQCAVSDNFKRISDELSQQILTKYNVQKPYIFYVGNAHPHKNLERLIKAFKLINKELPDLNLVLGGKKDFFYNRIQEELGEVQIKDKIIFTGFIDDSDLPALYSASEAFVNPSLYEGFGIQVLEAFACGTKVVCSKTTSLPEVGGNIAFYFNPRDIYDMSDSVVRCIKEDNKDRITQGYDRLKNFSWKKSAQIIYDVIISIK